MSRPLPKRDLDRRKIYRQIAREEGIFISEVEKAVESQFEFLADTMRRGDLEGVRLPHLGKFCVHPGRIKHLKEKQNTHPKRRGK